jgi:hypothetical protein
MLFTVLRSAPGVRFALARLTAHPVARTHAPIMTMELMIFLNTETPLFSLIFYGFEAAILHPSVQR